MTKKVYNAPYFKVVEVKNDILTTSVYAGVDGETGVVGAPGRGIWDDVEDEF